MKYDNHQTQYEEILSEQHRQLRESWLNRDNLSEWRHDRMRAPLGAFVKNNENHKWLTVWDGRYGLDGAFILGLGAKSVHCSDLSDTLLEIANKKGIIQEYSRQNAENLTFAENQFDYVYCKESLHHFPRPYIALHEMFRVARLAVIITEPRDLTVEKSIINSIRDTVKTIVGRELYRENNHEEVGNYIYTFSERELEKFLLGMHYRDIAFCDLNDRYIEGSEYVRLDSKNPGERKMIEGLMSKIRVADFLSKKRIRPSNLIASALFKSSPESGLVEELKSYSWRIKKLPKNPWLK